MGRDTRRLSNTRQHLTDDLLYTYYLLSIITYRRRKHHFPCTEGLLSLLSQTHWKFMEFFLVAAVGQHAGQILCNDITCRRIYPQILLVSFRHATEIKLLRTMVLAPRCVLYIFGSRFVGKCMILQNVPFENHMQPSSETRILD